MKFLIAGLGSIGRRHFRNLLALGERDIVLFRSLKATLPDEELSGFTVETDLQVALSHKPEVVIVSNPTSLHMDVAIPAAEMGCHLFIEKPISHSLDRIEELMSAVQRGGGMVSIGFQFRFHPGLQTVVRLLSEGQIGKPVSVRVHWGEFLPNWHPWEDFRQGYAARPELGGGVVLTLCHPLDYLRWLLGEIKSVWALTSQRGLGLEVEDSAEIGLCFQNGVIGSVHLDYIQRPPAHHLEIIGTEGTIRWDNADGNVQLACVGVDGKIQPWNLFSVPAGFERNTMFLTELKDLIERIQNRQPSVCPLEDGILSLKIAMAVLRSASQRRIENLL
jgi:predicted dehydrogenase